MIEYGQSFTDKLHVIVRRLAARPNEYAQQMITLCNPRGMNMWAEVSETPKGASFCKLCRQKLLNEGAVR